MSSIKQKRKAFIEEVEKEMSEIYRSFLEREKEKKAKFQAAVSEFAEKAFDIFKDDLKVPQCS